MKTLRLIAFAALVPMLAACHKDAKPEAADQVMPVDVSTAITDSITLHKTYPGTLFAKKTVQVVGRVNGTLLRKLYTDGDYVKAGQPLFAIEPTTYVNAVNSARAELANAQSAYDYASRNYAAMQRALAKDAVAQMEVLQSKSAMERAQAQINSARAALSDAQTKLGYCTVRAPYSGYVSEATLDPGAYVGGEVQPVVLATIYDNSSMLIHFDVEDESYIKVFADNAARVYGLDMKHIPVSFSQQLDRPYTAQLDYLAPAIDASTGTMLLKASIANPDNELRQGMYATISLPYRTEPRAVLVRDASISTDQRGKFLYVVNDSNRVVYRPITVGELYHDSLRVVESGIRPGDRYVTSALLKVRDGMQVKPIAR